MNERGNVRLRTDFPLASRDALERAHSKEVGTRWYR